MKYELLGAGLAYPILMAGIRLNVPRFLAALVLITLADVLMCLDVIAWAHLALTRSHESDMTPQD